MLCAVSFATTQNTMESTHYHELPATFLIQNQHQCSRQLQKKEKTTNASYNDTRILMTYICLIQQKIPNLFLYFCKIQAMSSSFGFFLLLFLPFGICQISFNSFGWKICSHFGLVVLEAAIQTIKAPTFNFLEMHIG
jgi:hypothetical protein